MSSCEYLQYTLQGDITSRRNTEDGTSQQKIITLSMTRYSTEMVQTMINYLYTGLDTF